MVRSPASALWPVPAVSRLDSGARRGPGASGAPRTPPVYPGCPPQQPLHTESQVTTNKAAVDTLVARAWATSQQQQTAGKADPRTAIRRAKAECGRRSVEGVWELEGLHLPYHVGAHACPISAGQPPVHQGMELRGQPVRLQDSTTSEQSHHANHVT